MAINKPEIPNVELPEDWGGIQTPYTNEQAQEGYPEAVPTVVDGGNLNFEKKGIFKNIKYMRAITDWLRNTPIKKIPVVNEQGQLDYSTPVVIATDEEYANGTSIEKSPNVAQVRDSFLDIDGKITNCITKIPQDIKLELNDGTLTLKAGSKVYVPNGVGKFDEITITSDTNIGLGTGSFAKMIFVKSDRTVATRTTPTTCYSGSSAPSGYKSMAWYDTSNNLVKLSSDDGSTWTSGYSLPIAIATITSDVITSIDQVFNGFGYIGNTVFALPGVKGLLPNGRNEDGSLNNREFTTNRALTTLVTSNTVVGVRENAIGISGNYSFDEINNQNNNSGSFWNVATIGDVIFSSGKITSFSTKLPFRAVDQNNFNDEVEKLDNKITELESKFQVVTVLPSSPTTGVFYFVKE